MARFFAGNTGPKLLVASDVISKMCFRPSRLGAYVVAREAFFAACERLGN